jgi:potassium-transporting ATPase potassium-binding subunit
LPGLLVLIFVTIALFTPAAISSILNPGSHGLSEIFYAFLSMANNNGSAFAGINANTLFYNLAGALVMVLGRFIPALAALAMAGSLAEKRYILPSAGALPTHGWIFIVWLIFIILIVGALSFLPIFAAGPVIEHLLMYGGG